MILTCKKEFGNNLNAKFTLDKKYEFKYETGVHYIECGDIYGSGLCPRCNADGSFIC